MRRWGGCGCIALAVVTIVLARDVAHGASFVVDSFSDDPDADPGDGTCATALAACTLRAAIEQANAIAGEPHTITLPAGSNGIKTPLPTVVQDVTVSGAGPYVSGITTWHPSQPTALLAVSAGRLSLQGLSLYGASTRPGSVLLATGGEVAITNCAIYQNTNGAVRAAASSTLATPVTITVTDTSFLNNTAGGALEVGTSYRLTLERSTFDSNFQADGRPGAAVAITGGGTGRDHTIADGTFTYNVADRGGAVAVLDVAGTLSITGSTFANDIGGLSATPDCGGGAIWSVQPNVAIVDSSFDHNSAGWLGCYGGAIASPQTPFSCRGCTFTGNYSYASGGAISGSGVTLVNSTFWGNGAGLTGGAIHVDDPSLPNALRTASVTIANNSAEGAGGGIAGGSANVVLKGTLLANWAPSGPDCTGAVASQGYNLIVDPTGCDFTATTGDQVGTPEMPVIAYVWGPDDNGGPTKTCALAPGSDAIDGGDPAGCTDADGTPLATDQRGVARPIDGDGIGGAVCDVGAYEAPTVTSTTSTTSSTTTSTLPAPVCDSGVAIEQARLTVKRVPAPSGDESFTLRGTLALPAGTPTTFDPAATGAQVLLEDLGNGGAVLLELSHRTTPIPAGPGCVPGDGWTRARWDNRSGAIDPPACTAGSSKGLRSLRFRDRRATGNGVAFAAVAKHATLGVPVGPFRATIVVGASTSASLAGDCGTVAFAAGACMPHGTAIRCR